MPASKKIRYPGIAAMMDGSGAVVACEQEASDGASQAPAPLTTRMGWLWGKEAATGKLNAFERPLIAVRVEGEPDQVAAVAGLASTGLRSTGFISAAALPACRESLRSMAEHHLPAVVHVDCGAGSGVEGTVSPESAESSVANSGCFLLFSRNVQAAADLSLISHRIAEQALVPGLVMQDIPAVSQGFESILLPERDLIVAFLGHPGQVIDAPTPAQRMVFGPTRRRIPEPWSVDDPAATGLPLGNKARTQAAAAHSWFYWGHLPGIADAAFDEFYRLTGRRYERIGAYRVEDASYLIVMRGGHVPLAEAVADYFRQTHRVKVGVADLTLCRPFPGERLSHLLAKRKGVVVLEAAPPSLCGDPPLLLEVRAAVGKSLDNGQAKGGELPFPEYAAYGRLEHAPPLHSALYGVEPSTPTAEDLIGAVQNMLPTGSGLRQLALSCDFHREPARSPKEEIYLQSLSDAYPQIKGLRVKRLGKQGGEHPHLLPKNAVTVRMYAVAGREVWGPNEHLGHTLFELTGLQVRARALPNQVQPGHSVAFHLVAAQDPIRCDGVDAPVDLVLVTDPRLFRLASPLAGLKNEGTLILQWKQGEHGEQSEAARQEAIWNDLPPEISREIRQRRIQVYAIDALSIAAGEDTSPELLDLAIGKVLQGCALVTPALAGLTRLSGKHLVRALREVLRKRNEEEELQTAEDELRVFQRGMEELIRLDVPNSEGAVPGAESAVPIAEGAVPGAEGAVPIAEGAVPGAEGAVPPGQISLPKLLKDWPVHPTPALNLHRLWAEGGVSHGRAVGEVENASLLAEPLLASGVTPAASAMLRDVSVLRSSFPRWVPESCTGCGACWMVCPDSALPGLVTGISELMETAMGLVEKQGLPIQHLPRAVRTLEKKLREHLASRTGGASVQEQMATAAVDTLNESSLAGDGRAALEQELEAFMNALGEFPLAVTEAYYAGPEKASPGNGGLLSVTLDPTKCKGCLACIASCPEEALIPEPQDGRVLVSQIRHWELQQALPTTHPRFIRTEPDPSSPEGFPGLESLLLDKRAYQSLTGGDDAQPGATERTVMHLFTALVEGLMQPRVAALLTRLEELIAGLDRHIRLHLAVDVEDPQVVRAAMGALKDHDFTLSQLSEQMDPERHPLDTDWLERVTGLLSGLKELKILYTRQGLTEGRASLGMVQTTTEAEAWGSTYPYNPFPFPWIGWGGGGAGITTAIVGLAAGIFDGHMARMAGAFKIIRGSELELEGKYNPEVHDSYFTHFGWRDFTEEEFALCPPVVIAGGNRTLPGGVWEGVSALLRTGRPLKVLNLDSQAYCSLLAPGSGERKEGGPLGMNTEGASSGAPMTGSLITAPPMTGPGSGAVYIAQCSLGNLPHLLESLKDGLSADRPALFNVYRSHLAENGSAAHQGVAQARLALESRAHPLFRFDPDAAGKFHECLSLAGNPEPDSHWPETTLQYLDGAGNSQSLTVPLTFAHYALTVPGLEHHFSPAPDNDSGASGPSLTPLGEYLELDAEEREETRPCIQTADARGRLLRLVVSPSMSRACEDRQRHWEALRSLTRRDIVPVDEEAISEQARMEMVERVAHSLFELAQGGDGLSSQLVRLSRVEDTMMENTKVETEGSGSNA